MDIHVARSQADLVNCFKLRSEVFVIEQQCNPVLELDGDEEATHIIARDNGECVGAARYRIIDGKAKIERVAVKKSARGKGVGKAIMEFCISELKKQGVKEVCLHAQTHAQKFYEKLGFKPEGETFLEANIEHINMTMKL